MTYRDILNNGITELKQAGIPNAQMEATWLLTALTGTSHTQLILRRDTPVDSETRKDFENLARRRAQGEPLQYLVGTTDFFGIELNTGPGVFIPRPETEVLVQKALEKYPGDGDICDLCTGSAAVAIALALNLPQAESVRISAVDLSETALSYAEQNRTQAGCNNVLLYQGNLFEPVPAEKKFSLITANPPYISQDMYQYLNDDVRLHEPAEALVSGQQGLGILKDIIRCAILRLTAGGWLLCEISPEQDTATREQFTANGYANVDTFLDHAQKVRIIAGQKPLS